MLYFVEKITVKINFTTISHDFSKIFKDLSNSMTSKGQKQDCEIPCIFQILHEHGNPVKNIADKSLHFRSCLSHSAENHTRDLFVKCTEK